MSRQPPQLIAQQQQQPAITLIDNRFVPTTFQNQSNLAHLQSQQHFRQGEYQNDVTTSTQQMNRNSNKPSLISGYHNPFSNSDRDLSSSSLFMNVTYSDKSTRFNQQSITPHKLQQQQQQQQQVSNTYVPQVEAISPTPEDQKETLNLLDLKQKICDEINKIDKDIASTQHQVNQLKKKQQDIENATSQQNKNNNTETINENDKRHSSSSSSSTIGSTLTLAEKIYEENRKKASESHAKINKTNENSQEQSTNIPLYHEYCDTFESKKIRNFFDEVMRKRLAIFFKKEIQLKKQREKVISEKYDELFEVWQRKIDKYENSNSKKTRDSKAREFYEKVFPEIRKQREEKERLYQKMLAEQVDVVDPQEEERKRFQQLAVIPPLCLNDKQKRFKFINKNGLVKDPVQLFKNKQNDINNWTEKEKELFLEKFLVFGKNFEIISSFIEKKTVKDCIEYYYLTKKKTNYKLLLRKSQKKRKKDAKSNNNNNISNLVAATNQLIQQQQQQQQQQQVHQQLSTSSIQYADNNNVNNTIESNINLAVNITSANVNLQNTTKNTNESSSNEENNNQNRDSNGNNNNNNNGDDNSNNDDQDKSSNEDDDNKLNFYKKCSICKNTKLKHTRKLPFNKYDYLNDNINDQLVNEFNLIDFDFTLNSKERLCQTCFIKFTKRLDEILITQETATNVDLSKSRSISPIISPDSLSTESTVSIVQDKNNNLLVDSESNQQGEEEDDDDESRLVIVNDEIINKTEELVKNGSVSKIIHDAIHVELTPPLNLTTAATTSSTDNSSMTTRSITSDTQLTQNIESSNKLIDENNQKNNKSIKISEFYEELLTKSQQKAPSTTTTTTTTTTSNNNNNNNNNNTPTSYNVLSALLSNNNDTCSNGVVDSSDNNKRPDSASNDSGGRNSSSLTLGNFIDRVILSVNHDLDTAINEHELSMITNANAANKPSLIGAILNKPLALTQIQSNSSSPAPSVTSSTSSNNTSSNMSTQELIKRTNQQANDQVQQQHLNQSKKLKADDICLEEQEKQLLQRVRASSITYNLLAQSDDHSNRQIDESRLQLCKSSSSTSLSSASNSINQKSINPSSSISPINLGDSQEIPRNRKNSMTMKLLCEENEKAFKLVSKSPANDKNEKPLNNPANQQLFGNMINSLIDEELNPSSEKNVSPNSKEKMAQKRPHDQSPRQTPIVSPHAPIVVENNDTKRLILEARSYAPQPSASPHIQNVPKGTISSSPFSAFYQQPQNHGFQQQGMPSGIRNPGLGAASVNPLFQFNPGFEMPLPQFLTQLRYQNPANLAAIIEQQQQQQRLYQAQLQQAQQQFQRPQISPQLSPQLIEQYQALQLAQARQNYIQQVMQQNAAIGGLDPSLIPYLSSPIFQEIQKHQQQQQKLSMTQQPSLDTQPQRTGSILSGTAQNSPKTSIQQQHQQPHLQHAFKKQILSESAAQKSKNQQTGYHVDYESLSDTDDA